MGLTGILIWILVIGVGFYINTALGAVLLVIAFVFLLAKVDAWLSADTPEQPSELPVERPAPSIASRAANAQKAIQYRKKVVIDAMIARREMDEAAAQQIRLLNENLKADRNESTDPQIREMVAYFDAYLLHNTANDFNHFLKAEKAKQEELPYAIHVVDEE